MTSAAIVTRFAPSPTGALHLGNARTALFNALLARSRPGGRFLLRIEDSDAARSSAAHVAQLQQDLAWLGLQWDGAVLQQSRRTARYQEALARLLAQGHAYPCFCSAEQLAAERAHQLRAGQPPRYGGRCRDLDESVRHARLAAGEPAVLRFRVPRTGTTTFDDLVHGPRRFANADIGDFVLWRADGSPAFFFCNALDDADSGVTHVLRGDDHLSNTPRQLLLLAALERPAPRYGHLALLTDLQGVPLSKRSGAQSLLALRGQGVLPGALLNLLFRLGHSSSMQHYGDLAELASAFDITHLQRAPARLDPAQLHAWQKEAVHRLDAAAAEAWLAPYLPEGLQEPARGAFIAAVLPNLVLPADAVQWLQVAQGEELAISPAARQAIDTAPAPLFAVAAAAAAAADVAGTADFTVIVAAVRAATGLKGAALFKPLRAALTGRLDGPELALLLRAMDPALVQRRLARFA